MVVCSLDLSSCLHGRTYSQLNRYLIPGQEGISAGSVCILEYYANDYITFKATYSLCRDVSFCFCFFLFFRLGFFCFSLREG